MKYNFSYNKQILLILLNGFQKMIFGIIDQTSDLLLSLDLSFFKNFIF